ncbi:iron complex transport system permease protein [Melghirimyces profundicolus]|uniref:Iron complex transport system permease protein n=1 Tax=Melghirimyces profundicolus TaxID=1242148 RepID=A0A2T6BXG0_9BACL|nr:iron ABC transporter permease [Melghirimyces profundicolus]PTX60760.1 iron complex transport system permease protein [Melghirimyces profundicolus]
MRSHPLHTPFRLTFGLTAGVLLLLTAFIGSIKLGLTRVDWQTLLEAFRTPDPTKEQLVVRSTRLPRALIAVSVGSSLAMAGALMQALTRNPLASPGIFGINAGAAFFVVAASAFFSVSSFQAYTWIAFFGAAISSLVVYGLGSTGRSGLTPLKLTLAGAAITAFFATLTQGVLVTNESTLDEVLFWLSGSIVGRDLSALAQVLPFMAVAWILTLGIARPITTLMMGDSVARGLGQRTGWVKFFASLCVVLLAGSAVAVAGPIGMAGLVVPHVARYLVGNDYRWMLPYCAVLGGAFLLLADIGARYLIMPGGPVVELLSGTGARVLADEVPVGVITALIGVPFFITIARRSVSE